MSKDPIADYNRERADRLNNVAPQRSQFDAPDVFGGRRDTEGATRVREHRAQQFREWHYRTHGAMPTEAQVREHLGE